MLENIPPSIWISLARDWIPRLAQSLGQANESGRKELETVANSFDDVLDLVSVYVEPDCQQFNPADFGEDEDRDLVRQPIFGRLADFFSGSRNPKNKRLLILADAGMGKTSLLVMAKLAHIDGLWAGIDKCVLLKLGPDVLTVAASLPDKARTVLLLDALDEDPTAWGRTNERILEVFAHTSVFYRVVVTCRTQFFDGDKDPFQNRGRVELGGYVFPLVYLSAFSREQVRFYLSKRLPEDTQAQSRATAILDKMKSLQSRPMLLAHIEDLVASELEEWTEFAVYEALVLAWLHRECRKLACRQERPPKVNELWKACQDVALHLHASGDYAISETSLKKLVAANPSISHLFLFDIKGRALLIRNSQGYFRFAHRSIQEFLVASALVNNEMDEGAEVMATDQLLAFVFSWMSKQTAETRGNVWLGALNMASMDLGGSVFDDADLSDINLASARLVRASMRGTDLTGAVLRKANASQLQLEGATLTEADWSEAKLGSSIMRSSSGTAVNFTKAVLEQADFVGARIEESLFVGARMSQTVCSGAILDRANAQQAVWCDAFLVGTSLVGADLAGADLSRSDLSKANLESARCEKMVAANARFRFTNAGRASFAYARMEAADLTGASLQHVDFRYAALTGCVFANADLSNADLQHADISGASFRGANLRNAKLAFVTGATFADFTEAILDGVAPFK